MAKHDLIIIGAGPGGYVAAIRAAQLGFNVGIIEKEAALGGTCVRVGCIPSKALLESSERYAELANFKDHGIELGSIKLDLKSMLARKDKVVRANTDGVAFLMKKNKISVYQGTGEIISAGQVTVHGKEGDTELECDKIIIATGSSVASIPGVSPDGELICTSNEAIDFQEVPGHLVVIGGGVIGLELGSVWKRLGAKVTVLEYFESILPGMDSEIAKEALKLFKKQGLEFHLGARVKGVSSDGKSCTVEIDGKDSVTCDRVLVATGRKPNTEGLGLEKMGLEQDKRGSILVNDQFETSVKGIYAIGDVIPGPMLAHKAEEDGVACVEMLKTGVGHVDYNLVPAIVYTHPEIASVGKTEEALKDAGIAYKKGVFPYMANGRARALGETDGKVKILADAKTDRVLGVHIIGASAGDLIAEAVAAMTFGASSEDIARTIHAHPTLAEIVKEAALGVHGNALHI
ncbi:MAG: dihydrolipoyl dehydrogenase [Trueperaceae bacterium]|nr:dihydrolipoyl dehydrogenase [Trueperaceae bacterium]